ncbi:MAG TPA: hypothetical protein VFI90_08270 [Rubrobacter sp.]|nr:hypothetical protein [Rubrobacter sp.]
MMTWLAWSAIALATLVAAVNAWITWRKLSGAYQTPVELEDLHEQSSGRRSKVGQEPPGITGDIDERGYFYRRRLQGGCEAAICCTPFGARIVAGASRLEVPQYAWDYTSVDQAHSALVQATFNTDPERGIVIDDVGFYPGAEPRDYARRWRYTADGQMQRF